MTRALVIVCAVIAGCSTATEKIARSSNEIGTLARSSGRRFETIHEETWKPDPSIPAIRTQAEGGIVEQEQILGLVDAVQVYLMGTTNITPWWAEVVTYALLALSISGVAFLVWHLGLGKFIRGWLGLITPAERRNAELAAELIEVGGDDARARVWQMRERDRMFDEAFRRTAPPQPVRKNRKKGSTHGARKR
jgi:hypothetical protein